MNPGSRVPRDQPAIAALARLHRVGCWYAENADPAPLVDAALETALALSGADAGSVHLAEDRPGGGVLLAAHREMPADFPSFCDSQEGLAAAAEAIAAGQQIVVEDLRRKSADRPALANAIAAGGFAGWVASPLIPGNSEPSGVISLCFRAPLGLAPETLQLVDLCARHAADFIALARERGRLREAGARDRDARTRAESASRAKDDFIALMAHEFRQPLAAAFAAFEVQKRSFSPERSRRAREVVEQQITHISQLVDDFSRMSRLGDAESFGLRAERIDLRRVVQAALDMTMPLFERRQHRTNVSLGDAAVWVTADPTRLTQVFSNLLQFSASYTPPGGNIEISLESRADMVSFRLRDDAIEESGGEREQIFDLFNRSAEEGSTPGLSPGLGLGLGLVRTLVNLHGGRVVAQLATPGGGGEFVVTLRGEGAPAEAGDPTRESPAPERP